MYRSPIIGRAGRGGHGRGGKNGRGYNESNRSNNRDSRLVSNPRNNTLDSAARSRHPNASQSVQQPPSRSSISRDNPRSPTVPSVLIDLNTPSPLDQVLNCIVMHQKKDMDSIEHILHGSQTSTEHGKGSGVLCS